MVAVFAHRGASAAQPENTVAAFCEAARLGADGVELDVRRSRDHALVVHHDARLADGRAIVDLEVADLPEGVPLLDAALEACQGMTVNVEIKNLPTDPDYDPEHYLSGAVARLVVERDLLDSVIVSSFSMESVDRAVEVEPRLQGAFLTLPQWDQGAALRRVLEGGHRYLHPHHLAVDAGLVAAAHDAGVAVNVWTVDDPDRIRWLAGVGVDGIITNVPDVALAVLRG